VTNQELYAEIKELRKDVKTLHKDFYIFKGKAISFIGVLSVIINATIAYILKQ
jgi:hypothetical protein